MVQRCDTCKVFGDDEAAGRAAEAAGLPGFWAFIPTDSELEADDDV
jgi:hypothetical protein